MKPRKRPQQLGFEILETKSVGLIGARPVALRGIGSAGAIGVRSAGTVAASPKHFGGAYLKNSNAKTKRPISTKKSMHLVMRSSLAKGAQSFLRKDKQIRSIISKQSKAFGVKVYRLANAGNHLHMIILPRSRAAFNGFIRSISGLIARAVLGVERGLSKDHPSVKGQHVSAKKLKINKLCFWDKRPFTRIVQWGREFKSVSQYLVQNTLEALGFLPFQPRRQRYNSA